MLDLRSSPLWDADGNLLFRIFELGKADTPLALLYDYQFSEMIDNFKDDLEVANMISKQRNIDPEEIYNPHEIPIKMPNLEGVKLPSIVVMMHISEGDEVIKGQPLFEVETDKATTEIVAPENGTISRILFKPGDKVYYGNTILKYLR
jgi:biotin carboxyl carrier protein